MLRRVAILLSSLPAPMAAKMLGNIEPETKQQLRRTMTGLADVDPLERQRAIEAFRVSIHQQPSHSSDPPVLKNAFPDSSTQSRPESISPLAFLADVDDDTLANLLRQEHPQAAALVMASIPPDQAGRVLPLLPEELRTQTISRIGRLGDIPHDAAGEIASHFQTQLNQIPKEASPSSGKKRLDAILASMPSAPATAPSASQVAASQVAASQVAASQVAAPPAAPLPKTSQPLNPSSDADSSAMDLSHRLRVVHEEPQATSLPSSVSRDTEESAARVLAPEVTSPVIPMDPLGSTDAIHQYLIALRPIELCQALAKVETRDAMLTLCGLPNPIAEAALSLLPKDQSKSVRRQMTSLNSLSLSDIDDAKERVARSSVTTTSDIHQAAAA